MFNLLYKEIKLVVNPYTYLFLLMTLLLFAPSYPYTVVVLFSYIGLQLSFQVAIGNKDDKFSALLPITRKQIVLSKFLLVWYTQGIYTIALIICALISYFTNGTGNLLSLDANFAYFGEAFIFYGVFNAVFLTGFFKTGHKLGLPLVLALIFSSMVGGAIELSIGYTPALKYALDGYATATVGYRLIMLAAGIVINALLNYIAYIISVKKFEKVNI